MNDDEGEHFTNDPEVAVIADSEVLEGAPVLFVFHYDEDGMWQFMGPSPPTSPVVVALGDIWKLHPDTRELADLPLGWQATRDAASEAWTLQLIPPEAVGPD